MTRVCATYTTFLFTFAIYNQFLHVLSAALPAAALVEFNFNIAPKPHRDGEGETLIAGLCNARQLNMQLKYMLNKKIQSA